jgi:homoserine O-acetyltransferase
MPQEGDYVARDFHFRSGETLPELRLHYRTFGKPARDAQGRVTNAVLILHGTGGSGRQFLQPNFAGVLFGPGQLLDTGRYFVILPDNIGHGSSSKPSDGMRAHFPQYDYDDMVAAQHELVEKGLGVNHLRLLMGTSMGCMHSWVWAETYPEFMDAVMPLACLPVQIAGRNRIWREMVMDGIRQDPEWKNGDYTGQPRAGIEIALDFLLIAGSTPLPMQNSLPTRDAADKYLADFMASRAAGLDVDRIAPRLAFFFDAQIGFFEEVAKYRAARRLWARIMRERLGARDPRSWTLRFHTQTAGVSLTAQQPDNNVVRVTLQALATLGQKSNPQGLPFTVSSLNATTITLSSLLTPANAGLVLGHAANGGLCGSTNFIVSAVNFGTGTMTENFNREVTGATLDFVVTVIDIFPA